MTLPYYGEYDGMYGYFTSEGFVYAFTDDNEGMLKQEVNPIEYDRVMECSEKDVEYIYNNLLFNGEY